MTGTLALTVLLPFLGSIGAGFLPSHARNAAASLAGITALACVVLLTLSYGRVADGDIMRLTVPWMPALLSPFSNPSWFETVSHKLLRLVCPWALAALVVSCASLVLSHPAPAARALASSMLGAQALFYLAASIGPRAGKLGSLCRTFVVMNAAAVVGLWRFLAGRQQVTW